MKIRSAELDEQVFLAEGETIHRPSRLMVAYRRFDGWILGGTAVVLFIAFWQWVGTSGVVNPLFVSAPSRIWLAFLSLAQGDLLNDIAISSLEFVYGFTLAIAVGIPLGILMGWYRPVEALFNPFVNFFYATPRIALLPLLIVWLGIGIHSKVAIVFLGAVFPVLINTIAGVKNLDESLIMAARSFGARDLQIFKTIALPGSVPFVLSGLRLGLGHALIGVVVGEFYAATAGVGYMIANAGNTFQTDKVFVGVIIVATAGLLITFGFQRLEDHFQSWRPQRSQ